jgi:predicted transcriptional regulator
VQRGTRGSGVVINHERIREARLAAGLTMAELAGGDVSRTFIHQIEHGLARPSPAVLEIIAGRTGKPIKYFTSPGADEHLAKQALAADMSKLSARVRRLRESKSLNGTQRQGVMVLESMLRHGALFLRSL